MEKVIKDYQCGHRGNMSAVDAATLMEMIEKEEVVLLRVRTEDEYNRGHIHKALSTPIDKLGTYLKKLPKAKTLVAYCRGPFCVYADEAVAFLQEKGHKAIRLKEGYPDWAIRGLPIRHKES